MNRYAADNDRANNNTVKSSRKQYGIGTLCLPIDEEERERVKELFECILLSNDLHLAGWNDIGDQKEAESFICQAYVEKPHSARAIREFNRRLRMAGQEFGERTYSNYISSLSCAV